MASGYEKAECGVDLNEGWGRPSRVENAVQWIVVSAGLVTMTVLICRAFATLFQ